MCLLPPLVCSFLVFSSFRFTPPLFRVILFLISKSSKKTHDCEHEVSPLGVASHDVRPVALLDAQHLQPLHIDEQPPSECTFVVSLHVRKCGGSTVRSLFQAMAPAWQEGGMGSIEGLRGLFWVEVHQFEDIVSFNKGVDVMRSTAEPGCKVGSCGISG